MAITLKAFPSAEDVFLVWRLAPAEAIAGCRGFAVFRRVNGGDPEPLETWVGFSGNKPDQEGEHKPSTEWPIQKFNWTDYILEAGQRVSYRVVPVLREDDGNLKTDDPNGSNWTPEVTVGKSGILTPYFNRGSISAQWVSRALGSAPDPSKELLTEISTSGNKIRDLLSGNMRERIVSLLSDAKQNGTDVYASLFELDDPELLDLLRSLGDHLHVVIGNSTGRSSKKGPTAGAGSLADEYQLTAESRAALAKTTSDLTERTIAPKAYAHNKFVVFCDKSGKPERVWTGSMNWTRTGLCTQNNNSLEIADAGVASDYLDYWKELKSEGARSDSALRKANANEHDRQVPSGAKLRFWRTPVAEQQDLQAAEELINQAKQGIMFLMLNPGPRGLLGPIVERVSPAGSHHAPDLYIRGVLNQFPTEGQDKEDGDVHLIGAAPVHGGTLPELRQKMPSDILKPAGIKFGKDWWERELANTGKFMIAVHSKIIVLDPLGANPVVMTGSHNFSARASGINDDNLVIVEGDRDLAVSYAVNILGIWQHYRWRAWYNKGSDFKGIADNDTWMKGYLSDANVNRELDFWTGGA